MTQDSTHPTGEAGRAGRRGGMLSAIIGFAIYLFLAPAVLFLAAGTLDWPMAWVYVGLLLASVIGSRLVVWLRNPDALRERAQYREKEDALPGDRLLVSIVALIGPLAIALVSGLDHRFGWPPAVSPLWRACSRAGSRSTPRRRLSIATTTGSICYR